MARASSETLLDGGPTSQYQSCSSRDVEDAAILDPGVRRERDAGFENAHILGEFDSHEERSSHRGASQTKGRQPMIAFTIGQDTARGEPTAGKQHARVDRPHQRVKSCLPGKEDFGICASRHRERQKEETEGQELCQDEEPYDRSAGKLPLGRSVVEEDVTGLLLSAQIGKQQSLGG